MTILSSGERDRLDTALRDVASAAGIDPAGAVLLRYTMNAVYKLPAANLVLRIAPVANRLTVHRVTKIAHRLAELDLPTVRLAPGLQEPIETSGWAATAWTTSRRSPGNVTGKPNLPVRCWHSTRSTISDSRSHNGIPSAARSLASSRRGSSGRRTRHLKTWAADQVGLEP